MIQLSNANAGEGSRGSIYSRHTSTRETAMRNHVLLCAVVLLSACAEAETDADAAADTTAAVTPAGTGRSILTLYRSAAQPNAGSGSNTRPLMGR